jgi:secondary thiamine-phosphate synthase enzyme
MLSSFNLRTSSRTQLIGITSEVREIIRKAGVKEGICLVYVPHTTAGLIINESADPSVARDITMELDKIIPFEDNYTHMEGNSAAHIKSSLVGVSCQIPVVDGDLALGRWQGIFFCEFDGPRKRSVRVSLIGR